MCFCAVASSSDSMVSIMPFRDWIGLKAVSHSTLQSSRLYAIELICKGVDRSRITRSDILNYTKLHYTTYVHRMIRKYASINENTYTHQQTHSWTHIYVHTHTHSCINTHTHTHTHTCHCVLLPLNTQNN